MVQFYGDPLLYFFSSFLFEYPTLIFIFRVILAIALAIIVIGGMMSYLFPYIEIPKRSLKGKRFNSGTIFKI